MADHGSESGGGHRRREREGSWIAGVVLILIGVVFLLENANLIALTGNWWALFIYVAAFAAFANSFRSYRAHQGFNSSGGGSLTWGMVLTVVATILLFDLQWDVWWPAILVAVGVGIIVGYALPARS